MLSLYQKVQKTESLQRRIDKDIRLFKLRHGLDCPVNCSVCCDKDDIMAVPVEFLPFAWHARRLGQLEFWYDKLENMQGSNNCLFYRNIQGSWGCQIYPSRGLICRLFGFSASLNKLGKPSFGACRMLKLHFPEQVERAQASINGGEAIPVISDYYRRLFSVDPCLSQDFMQINSAIKKAIELVWLYGTYRECA